MRPIREPLSGTATGVVCAWKSGDIIRKFNGKTVGDSGKFLAMVASTNPGTPVTLEILRDGKPQTVPQPQE